MLNVTRQDIETVVQEVLGANYRATYNDKLKNGGRALKFRLTPATNAQCFTIETALKEKFPSATEVVAYHVSAVPAYYQCDDAMLDLRVRVRFDKSNI